MTDPLTQPGVVEAREHFAALARECIDAAKSGEMYVNNLQSYIEWEESFAADCLAGLFDDTFTHRQMAHYFATGECVPLLPPAALSEQGGS